MNVKIQQKQNILIIKVEGELDMHSAGQFRRAVEEALSTTGCKNLLLSFHAVTFIDSSGLGVILGRYRKVSQLGGTVGFVGLQSQVQRICELSGLFKIISVYKSEAEALQNRMEAAQ